MAFLAESGAEKYFFLDRFIGSNRRLKEFVYITPDDLTTILVAGYFTFAWSQAIRPGDVIRVIRATDRNNLTTYIEEYALVVTAVTGTILTVIVKIIDIAMLDLGFSALTALPGADAASGDVLAIEDISAALTKKISLDELNNALGGITMATRTALAATLPQAGTRYLSEGGRAGYFRWDASDLSARVTADTRQGVYVAPTAAPTGASGAWVRMYDGALQAGWFGITADGVADDAPAIQAAIDLLEAIDAGGAIELGFELAAIASTLTINQDNIKLIGAGGGYVRSGIQSFKNSSATRLLWTGAAGGTMVQYLTLAGVQEKSGGGMTGIMLDGNNFSAATGLEIRTWRRQLYEDCTFFACSAEQVLLGVVDYALSSGQAATQHITFRNCLASTFGGSGTYLTSTAKGWRLTGGTTAQDGNTSYCDFYSCYALMSLGVGFFLENTDSCLFVSCSGGASLDAAQYGYVLNSSDQDTGTRAATARFHTFHGCAGKVHVRASQTGAGSAHGHAFLGFNRANGVAPPVYEAAAGGSNPSRGIAVDEGSSTTSPSVRVNGVTRVSEDYPLGGTYTPTLTNVTNLDGSGALSCTYLRVGDSVTVSGACTVDPTAAVATELGISLPIASNLSAAQQCAGVAFSGAVAGQGAAILGDTVNDRASMRWIAADLSSRTMYFTFTYQVI